MPVPNKEFAIVTSVDKKSLYAIAGSGSGGSSSDIYKYSCTGHINTCKWTETSTTLKFARQDFVAIPIPDSLADKLCK